MDNLYALEHLKIILLEHLGESKYVYPTQLPSWADFLGFEPLSDKILEFKAEDTPLSFFIEQAQDMWKKSLESKISEFFSILDQNQESILFLASAFCAKNKEGNVTSFLMLEMLDQESDLRVVGLQKTREIMLSRELEQQLLAERTLRLEQEEASRIEILKLLDRVEEKNKELSSFATIVAHDPVSYTHLTLPTNREV